VAEGEAIWEPGMDPLAPKPKPPEDAAAGADSGPDGKPVEGVSPTAEGVPAAAPLQGVSPSA
jgi:hypothetical protein